MAGSQTEIVANQIEDQRKGFLGLSLTNYDNDSEPQIAAGSTVELSGAVFAFASAESITGWGGIGTSTDVYIKLVVAGAAITAEFTTAAPTWSTSKQGWYGTAGSALHRYVAKLYKDGSGNYTLKRMLPNDPNANLERRGDGTMNAADEFYFADKIRIKSTGDLCGDDVAAGSTVNLSANTSQNLTNSGSMLKLKEILCPFGGTITVDFDAANTTASAYAQVYIDGVAIGTLRTVPPDSLPHTYSEDFAVTPGQAVQLYARKTFDTFAANVSNFRIKSDRSLPPLFGRLAALFVVQN